MAGVRTVLALRALGLGDLCAAVPALRALCNAFPEADLVLAAPAWQEPLARLAGVDRVVDAAPLAPLDPSVHGADLAVNLHGRGPESTEVLLASEPRRLVAFHHADVGPEVDTPTVATVTWRPDEHEVHRWCRLLTGSGIDADPADVHLARPGVAPVVAPGAVVVHPGAAAPARRWPAERFAHVVAALVRRGEQVVLTGSASERELCARVLAAAGDHAAGRVTILAGETDLLQLAVTVADASLVVANDTGVAHLATAFAVPSVVLFGPTPPSWWGPPEHGPYQALWTGGRGDPHGERLDPGLAEITVPHVLAAIEEVSGRVPV